MITADRLPRGLVGDERVISLPPVVVAARAAEVSTPSFQLPDEGIIWRGWSCRWCARRWNEAGAIKLAPPNCWAFRAISFVIV